MIALGGLRRAVLVVFDLFSVDLASAENVDEAGNSAVVRRFPA